jgi:hypothetical protein
MRTGAAAWVSSKKGSFTRELRLSGMIRNAETNFGAHHETALKSVDLF